MKLSVFYHHLLAAAQQTGLSREEILDKASHLGYEGVECDLDALGEDPAGFAQELGRHGLAVATVDAWLNFPKGEPEDKLLTMLHKVRAAGCRKLLAVPSKIPEGETPEDTEAICQGLNLLCRLAEDLGITVLVEDFDSVQSPCGSPEKLLNLFEQVPRLRFALDTGNFFYLDRDTLACVPPLLPRIAHMHLKDRSLTPILPGAYIQKSAGGRDMYDAPVGGGEIPMAQLLKLAKEQGYDDWCSAEFFSAPDMLHFLERSAQWLADALR